MAIAWFYYGQTHLKVPDFTGKSVSTAQTWADEHKVKLDIKRVYDFDQKINQVIKASDKNQTISKKKTVKLTVSLGADPKEKLSCLILLSCPLVKRVTLSRKINLRIQSCNWTTLKPSLKMPISSKLLPIKRLRLRLFKREDNLTLYYSKGKEPILQNIDVPDFSSQTKDQITTWGKEKGLKLLLRQGAVRRLRRIK